jgi:ribosomal-protein-alanine N-acetyltransferase
VYRLDVMRQDDVPEVGRLERRCFPNPWPASAYRRELQNPAQNYYVVLRDTRALPTSANGTAPTRNDELDASQRGLPRRSLLPIGRTRRPESVEAHAGSLVGFAGMWHAFDEAHVTTIGIDPHYRGRGLGELLFLCMVDAAIARGTNWLTLEVRVSNVPAQTLYRKYGFTVHGTRKRYYSDNNEDALIMWSRALNETDVRAQIEHRRQRLAERLGAEVQPEPMSPLVIPVSRVTG